MKEFIKNLQSKPYETRLKIMWGAVAVAGVALVAVFVWNLKSVIQSTSADRLFVPPANNTSSQLDANVLTVEKVETKNGKFRIYFNLNNTTDDILNMALGEDITLTVNNEDLHPEEILDRQGQPFVQKVLSKTQNFGTLVFPAVLGTQGELEFDRMYFEKNPDAMFRQAVELDFSQLTNDNPIRN